LVSTLTEQRQLDFPIEESLPLNLPIAIAAAAHRSVGPGASLDVAIVNDNFVVRGQVLESSFPDI
jgi:hypothetical protein